VTLEESAALLHSNMCVLVFFNVSTLNNESHACFRILSPELTKKTIYLIL
jgi:hypothetical protein